MVKGYIIGSFDKVIFVKILDEVHTIDISKNSTHLSTGDIVNIDYNNNEIFKIGEFDTCKKSLELPCNEKIKNNKKPW